MAIFVFSMPKEEAVNSVKKELSQKMNIFKEKDCTLTVGKPLKRVKICFSEKNVAVYTRSFGAKEVEKTEAVIENIEGFKKV